MKRHNIETHSSGIEKGEWSKIWFTWLFLFNLKTIYACCDLNALDIWPDHILENI